MSDLYLDGEAAHSGESLVASLRHLYSARLTLPRAARALKGWRLLAPPKQRLPLPRQAVMAICGWLMARRQAQMAVAVALAFCCYLRPSELMALRGSHLVPPCSLANLPFWGLLLHDSDLGIPGKTGTWDAAVTLDLDQFLWPAMAALHAGRRHHQPVWDFQLYQLRTLFKQACQELGLEKLTDHLYGLRHGGASDDLLHRRRGLISIRERGRWLTDTSLRRYAKPTLLQRELTKVPPAVLAFGSQVQQQFSQLPITANSAAGFPLTVPVLQPGGRKRRRK